MNESADLITTAQTAEILGRTVATINRWAADGKLPPAFQAPGRTGVNLFHRTDIEAFKAELDAEKAAS